MMVLDEHNIIRKLINLLLHTKASPTLVILSMVRTTQFHLVNIEAEASLTTKRTEFVQNKLIIPETLGQSCG